LSPGDSLSTTTSINFPNPLQTIKMKFTTVVATILSMAVFAIAAPVSTGMFDPRNTL
jgi:hypothetical protein